jgi:hypothetical protein
VCFCDCSNPKNIQHCVETAVVLIKETILVNQQFIDELNLFVALCFAVPEQCKHPQCQTLPVKLIIGIGCVGVKKWFNTSGQL